MAFNINNNNTNEEEQLGFLDVITIIGFIAQLTNMADDEKQTKYIKIIIEAIANEIAKLHKENDDIIAQNEYIIKQNDEILKLLKGMGA
jgi:uncharacterized protein (UPF0305 family)